MKVQSTVFSQFCHDNDIRQTMFRTRGCSKTILAIDVRFNRTLRIKIAKQVKLHGNKERKILIRAASKFFPPKQELSVATVALLGNKVQRVASFFLPKFGPLFLFQSILNTEDDLYFTKQWGLDAISIFELFYMGRGGWELQPLICSALSNQNYCWAKCFGDTMRPTRIW